MKRTRKDLLEELQKQVKFIIRSCSTFDSGDEDEAVRIAAALRILVHDTSRSNSLLKLLRVKDQLEFIDSSLPIDPQPTGAKKDGKTIMIVQGLPGLVSISVTKQGTKFVAPLSLRKHSKGMIRFNEWWNEKNIPGHESSRYSRKWLVTNLANKEGGSHVDSEINKGYKDLRSSSLGMTVVANGIEGFINSSADVSIRQIAWEIIETLKHNESTIWGKGR
jgi:hypothetical protein